MNAGSLKLLEANKDVVRKFLAAVDRCDFAACREILSADLIAHFPGATLNRDQFEAAANAFYGAFPDLTHSVEDLLAAGDRVVLRMTAGGTHRGNFQGVAATYRSVEFGTIAIYRIVGSSIAEFWEQADLLGLMKQIG